MSLPCDHDERFSGVFLLPPEDQGCIACAFERVSAGVSTLLCEGELKDAVIEAVKALTWHPKMLRDEKVKRLGRALKELRLVSEEPAPQRHDSRATYLCPRCKMGFPSKGAQHNHYMKCTYVTD